MNWRYPLLSLMLATVATALPAQDVKTTPPPPAPTSTASVPAVQGSLEVQSASAWLAAPKTPEATASNEVATSANDPTTRPDFSAEDRALAEYTRGLVEGVLRRDQIAGMVVAVVDRDRVRLAEGYGYAVIDPERRADGDTTRFRIGSISKTFTYTAAMQLIEQGKLGLDDAVNDRLPPDLRVPDDGFAQPILIRHLLSHTAGFEDSALGHLFANDAANVLAPSDYLVKHRPKRVRAPGVQAVYSNYSVALLGAVIAQVSGESYIDYVEHHLTGPLGMRHATFREPLLADDPRRLDPAQAADIATGYARVNGKFEPGDFEFIAHGAAAGGMSATAADMARWMRVHLREGEVDGVRVLSADSARRMHDVLFRNSRDVPGITHGFLTLKFGPHQAWGHGGALLRFHSAMWLIPDAGIGVFVSANTDKARAPVADVARQLITHLLPDARDTPKPIALTPAQLAEYVGKYRSTRRAYSTVEKLFMASLDDDTVIAGDDGTLRIDTGQGFERYVPIGEDLFRNAENEYVLQFLRDERGQPTRFAYGIGIATFERLAWHEQLQALGLGLLLALLIAIARLWRGLRGARKGEDPRPGLSGVKLLSYLSAFAWLAAVVSLISAVVRAMNAGVGLLYIYPTSELVLATWLTAAAAIISAIEVLTLVMVWRGGWRAGSKWRYTFAVVVLAAVAALLWQWNLVLKPAAI